MSGDGCRGCVRGSSEGTNSLGRPSIDCWRLARDLLRLAEFGWRQAWTWRATMRVGACAHGGYRTVVQGVALQRPHMPGFNRSDAYAIDDWR
jgi:hypothetical protein